MGSIQLRIIIISLLILMFVAKTSAATITVNINLLDATNGASNQGVLSLKNKDPSSSDKLEPLERELSQYNAQFTPLITVIPQGSSVSFPNKDEFSHHVYSFSDAKTFDSELYDKNSTFNVEFDQSGVVTVGCNIHDWMVAYIYILDTPIYKSTEQGQVSFDNIDNGHYELTFWQPSMSEAYTKDIVIAGDMSIDFDIKQNITEIVPFPAPSRTFWEEDDY